MINYVSSEERAKETEAKITSQYAVKTAIVQGVCSLFPSYRGRGWLTVFQDLGVKEDCVRIVKTAIEVLGGLDIIISNAVSHAYLTFSEYITDLLWRF